MISHSKPWISKNDIEAIHQTLQSGYVSKGALVERFEEKVAEYVGCNNAFATTSGTAAIILALKALNISQDDEVLLPTYVCDSVIYAVQAVGATPVICDVGIHWTMTKKNVSPFVSPKTKAVIVVHSFGIAADIEDIVDLGIPVIEDACQSFGLEINGRKAGSIGDIGIFSFHATKCLTTGEGGMAVTSDTTLADTMCQLTQKKQVQASLTDLQAALGLSQLERYDEMLAKRKEIADYYLCHLPSEVLVKTEEIKKQTIFFRFPLRIKADFIEVKSYCEREGVSVRKGVDALLHRMFELEDDRFQNATKLLEETISIPIYPALSKEEYERVLAVVSVYL